MSGERALGLSELGRRIERLFYLGALLTIVCAIQLYLVTTLSFIRRDNPASYAVLADRIESDLPHLRHAFDRPAGPPPKASKDTSGIDHNRQLLGLPPSRPPVATPEPESYHRLITSIISDTAHNTGLAEASLENLIDEKNSPEKLIEQIREKVRALASKPVTVWGIETPITVPLQYGEAKYEVPTSFIATCLRAALAPLVLGWLVSFYATRKRELGLIRMSTSYYETFPHLLNLFPLRSIRPTSRWDAKLPNARTVRIDRLIDRIMLSTGRSFTLLIITAPMLVLGSYAEAKLAAITEHVTLFDLMLSILVIGLAAITIAVGVIQEWLYGWPKEFVQS